MQPVESNVIEQASIQERNLEVFLKNFPGVVSTGEDGELVINADKLKLALDPKARFEENGYELNWVGKKEAYHQAYAKQAKILQPLEADSKLLDGSDLLADSTQNILIKGDNLQALKLLKASYFEQIKMIYIDPPYNTKSENFIYRDNFTESEDAILDELGYSPEYKDYIENIQGARTHSGWLSFMFPRLLLARDLLKEDGVIFISIDDNEQANLKLLCDEVFGENNFIANVIWEKKYTRSNDAKWFSDNHDHVLCYGKNKDIIRLNALPRNEKQLSAYSNPDNHPKGKWKSTPLHAKSGTNYNGYTFSNGVYWEPPAGTYRRFNDASMKKMDENDEIWFGSDGMQIPSRKSFLSEVKDGLTPVTLWRYEEVGHNHEANNELKELIMDGVFNNPKPSRLVKQTLLLATEKNDLVLDFFAGSGTTGQAVMDLNAEDGGNRKFILVQLPEEIDPKKQKDAYEFVIKTLGKKEATIFEITAERLRRAGDKILNAKLSMLNKDENSTLNIQNSTLSLDIGFKAFEIADDPMQQFYKPLHEVTPDILEQLEIALSAETLEDSLPTILSNLLLAEKLPLSTPITTLQINCLYQAANVLLIVNDLPISDIKRHLSQPANRVEYVSIYSPNISGSKRDQFSQELKPALLQMGLDESRLRFRG
ncbi:MAG: site-specific DNA-methyltransferase [Methyloprofundus sp.]|nr:site-specific DNA-methyltransferase [Methyloprofundus sp.]